jgi:coenzyme F420-reducing hydrogenase gamma subunit
MSDKRTKKIRLGWFSFSCSEDSTIVMTEIMNDHWQAWKESFEFVYARILQTKNKLGPMDIAFVEGAIARGEQEKKLKIIRKKAKLLIAVGACAVTGMPSAQRNFFSDEAKNEVEFFIERFGHLEKVLKVAEVVKIDAEIPGCPMNPDKFLEVVNWAVNEIKASRLKRKK